MAAPGRKPTITFASGAGAATQNVKIPAEGFPAERRAPPACLGAPQHQRLTGVGAPSGQLYNVNLVQSNVFNARIDGANVTTIETMMNVVSLGSGESFQIQTVLHTTINANGETSTQFQNFHVHCKG